MPKRTMPLSSDAAKPRSVRKPLLSIAAFSTRSVVGVNERPGRVNGERDEAGPVTRADPVGRSYVGPWPLTEFDHVIHQLFNGTLADEERYALDFECPGCGHHGTVRSNHPVRIEWDPIIDGRYIGYAICASTEIIAEFWMTIDRELEEAWQVGSMPPESDYGQSLGTVRHECSGGGESNDRAALSPNPPPRSSSIERAVDD